MQYKTIILGLIEQQPELHEQLRASRTMLATLNRCATLLKERHEALKDQLRRSRPQADDYQLASEAMELAVKEFEQALSAEPASGQAEFPLDEAMAFLRRHTPPA